MAVFWAVGGHWVGPGVVWTGCARRGIEAVIITVGVGPGHTRHAHAFALLYEPAVALAVGLLGGCFGGLGVGLAVCTSIESNCIFVCVGGTGYTVAVGASTQRICAVKSVSSFVNFFF